MNLLSQQEEINTNSWTVDLKEPYIPISIKQNNLKKYYDKMTAWKNYQLILKGEK
jgi:hypothetical protein